MIALGDITAGKRPKDTNDGVGIPKDASFDVPFVPHGTERGRPVALVLVV
ncbi:hypothetical protein [Halorussus amylolyticus]|nr:hypothetical protein [Halorussus amylolyticus]